MGTLLYPESEIYDPENAGYWPPEDPTDISDLLMSVLPGVLPNVS